VGGHILSDWFFNVLSNSDSGKETMMSRKLSALKTLLEQMNVPARRTEVDNISNIRWLARNLAVENKEHPMFDTTQRLVVWILRNQNKS
jgi:hypothetical protein